MADTTEVIERLKESRPPATDTFTYLTIVEKSLSPAVLPALHEILEDVELTKDIGWDLVEMLISIPGSDECLETIARLGNPREVILKVLEVLEKMTDEESEDEEEQVADHNEGSESTKKFITLLGMLGILHKRLEVKAPSRFVHSTLQTVYRTYNPQDPLTTAAVIALTRSLSGQRRPLLPTRKSSTTLDTPFRDSDSSKNAPDPEAEKLDSLDPIETVLTTRLLRAFITCIIEAFVNSNRIEWASRLLEFYNPERIVAGRPSMMQAFKQDPELLARDALMGQLVAIAGDLGLSKMRPEAIKEQCEAPIIRNPLLVEPDPEYPDAINVSTTGFWCLTAYWMFASELFDAGYERPDMNMFPDHFDILQRFLSEDAQNQITSNPGTMEALLVMGLCLDNGKRIKQSDEVKANFMTYHHLLTLISVFHPSLNTRNVATTLAGLVFHADPDDGDRLKILEDLLENCVFASLQACAVSWLKEELVIAQKLKLTNHFSTSDPIETLQYSLFPNVVFLKEANLLALWDYWIQNYPFHLQVANFAYFLFAEGSDYKHLVPAGMGPAIEQRYVEPLLSAAKLLEGALAKGNIDDQGMGDEVKMQLEVLTDRLKGVPLQ